MIPVEYGIIMNYIYILKIIIIIYDSCGSNRWPQWLSGLNLRKLDICCV